MNSTIIGGGITGLTIAVGLQRKGLDFEIYESAAEFRPLGAGIILSPNALFVFDQLGLYDVLKQHSYPLQRFDIADMKAKVLQKNDTQFSVHGKTYCSLGIHRGDLQRVLLDHIPAANIHFGRKLTSLDPQTQTLYFQGQDPIRAKLVLACDGIHSAVRQTLFPQAKLRYSKQTCWRGIAATSLSEARLASPAELWGN